jgi:hypothetical protein
VSLESQQKASQFVIVDPASFPQDPSSPASSAFILIGLMLSLAIGCASAWIVDSLNQKVWTQSELERLLQAPVLVEIPALVSASDRRQAWKGRLAHAVLFFVFAGIYAGGLYLIYLNRTSVVRILNPLIERITS